VNPEKLFLIKQLNAIEPGKTMKNPMKCGYGQTSGDGIAAGRPVEYFIL
jgi:hypothetical protein